MTVYLVGAGPGDGDLLTLRAARLISEADVVVHDRLVSSTVLEHRRGDARVIDVGKGVGDHERQSAINALLVRLATQYEKVVRLKGGAPFLFGRGGEEVNALREAGITYEVVPGVSSALAAPLAAGVPVTHRGVSRGVVVVSGSARDGGASELRDVAALGLTIVILMGAATRHEIVRQLLAGGLSPSTPCACVERAYSPDQRTTYGPVSELATWSLRAPVVIVVGEVATFARGTHRAEAGALS